MLLSTLGTSQPNKGLSTRYIITQQGAQYQINSRMHNCTSWPNSQLSRLSALIVTCLAVKGLTELVNGRRNLQTLDENGTLALETNILGPPDKAAKISFGLDVLTQNNKWIQLGTCQEQITTIETTIKLKFQY